MLERMRGSRQATGGVDRGDGERLLAWYPAAKKLTSTLGHNSLFSRGNCWLSTSERTVSNRPTGFWWVRGGKGRMAW